MEIRKALVVDDSKLASMTLTKMLQQRSIEVATASSGEEAIAYLRDNRPDVIFMDLMMPGMDGYQATQLVRTDPDTADIPVVMCTAQDSPADRDKADGAGATGFLTKPATPQGLDDVLQTLQQLIPATMAGQLETPAMEPPRGGPAPEVTSEVTAAQREVEVAQSTAQAVAEQVAKEVADIVARAAAEEAAAQTARSVAEQTTQEVAKQATERMLAEVVQSARETLTREVEEQVRSLTSSEVQKFVASDAVKDLIVEITRSTIKGENQAIRLIATEVAEGVAERSARLAAEETVNAMAERTSRGAASPLKAVVTVMAVVLTLVTGYVIYDAWSHFFPGG